MGVIDKIFGKKKDFKKEGFEQTEDKGNIKKFGDTEYRDTLRRQFKEDGNVEQLIQPLRHRNKTIRKETTKILGEVGSKEAVKLLTQSLKDEDIDVRVEAAKSLGEQAKFALALATLSAKEGTKIHRNQAVVSFFGDAFDLAVESLIQLLREEISNDAKRADVIKTLGSIGDARAVDPLIQTLKDILKIQPNEELSIGLENLSIKEVINALVKIGDEKAIDPLYQLLKDHWTNWYVLWSTPNALDKLGWKPSDKFEQILYLVSKEKWDKVVNEHGAGAIEPLTQILMDRIAGLTFDITLQVLAKTELEAVAQTIGSRSDMDFLRGIAESLAELNALEPINKVLERDLHFDDPYFDKFCIVKTLSESKNRKVIEFLKRKIKKGDWEVICGAYPLIIRLGEPNSEELLIERLSTVNVVFGSDGEISPILMAWYRVMAEDFLNCGNPKLEKAAKKWAAAIRGFKIIKKSDYNGPKWGEGVG